MRPYGGDRTYYDCRTSKKVGKPIKVEQDHHAKKSRARREGKVDLLGEISEGPLSNEESTS
jgi:hypothetical protein